MTRKDYQLIASALERAKDDDSHLCCLAQWADTVDCLADALEQENPRFDRSQFLIACGIDS